MRQYIIWEINTPCGNVHLVSNVDPIEIEKFSSSAALWWETNGPYRPLHQLNPIRLDFIAQRATLKDQNILDVGCGGGILSESLAKAGAKVTGIDMSEAVIKIAKLHALEQQVALTYAVESMETHAQNNPESYDLITCMELLEHVPDPKQMIADIYTALRPGGKAFFSTLNRNLKAFLIAIVGAEYVLNILPRGTHQYDTFIKPSELIATCRKCGFTPICTQGIHYQIFEQRFVASERCDVNYLLCVEK